MSAWMDVRIKVSSELHAAITALADHEGLTIDKWCRSKLDEFVRDQVRRAELLDAISELGGHPGTPATVTLAKARS